MAEKKVWKRDPSVPPRDHYQEITDKIVAALEAGTPPWKKPWDPEKTGGPQAPMNPTTGKRYRGVNTLILGMDPRSFASGDPRWMTFNQAKDKGWMVKKGERATTIFFYKKLEVADADAKDGKREIPVLKAYAVFHASQIDNIPAYKAPDVSASPWRRPEAANVILTNSGAAVRIGGERAYYSPGTDHIQLPPDAAFERPEDWSATALHELGHWSGHKSRLDRDLTGRFGSGAYAQEELRAELSSVFVGAELGIPSDIPHHASYVQSWLKALKEDKREIFRAASDAQKIADYELAFHPDFKAADAVEAKDEVEVEPEAPAPYTPAAPDFRAALERNASRSPAEIAAFAAAAGPPPAPDFRAALSKGPAAEPGMRPR
jgi:antirestriction protein ArdC